MTPEAKKKMDGSMFVGILLLGIGALFLLNNLDFIYVGRVWDYWPFILVALGIQKVVTAGSRDKVGSGLWLAFLGLWLFVSIQEIWDLGFRETWPALLIAWGVGIIWRSFDRPWPFDRKENVS
jgi:hypothetical protein